MKQKFILWLSLLAVFCSSLHSCRNDYLSEQPDIYNNSSGFQLTSKRISLNESKHKAKLLPELEKVKAGFKAKLKSNAFGKTVHYGDGVYINTDDVIYIENGPNYHTYTFKIERENASENASENDPVENLLLSPLPDGSYQEFLVTYNLTPQEKEKIRNGEAVNTKGKTSITELAKGSFNSSGQLTQAKTTCYWTDVTIVYGCSQINSSTGNSVHHAGNMSDWHNCTAETKPVAITAGVWNCGMEGEDNYISPGNQPGSGPGGEGTGSGTTPDDCTTVASNPGEVGIVNPNGCNTGVPTLPNLGETPVNDPCKKTKASITAANDILHNPIVQQEMTAVLEGKVNHINEWGVAVGKDANGQYEVTAPVEGTPSKVTPPINNLSIPSSAIATGHSHAKAFGNPSGGDMFSILGNMLNFPNLRYSYIFGIAPNGTKETYALVINDAALATQFLADYPKIKNYNEVTHDINDRTELGKEFKKMKYIYDYYFPEGMISGEYLDRGATAMAYILEKFNSGISIAKADANGNLKKINASIQTTANGEEKPVVSKCP